MTLNAGGLDRADTLHGIGRITYTTQGIDTARYEDTRNRHTCNGPASTQRKQGSSAEHLNERRHNARTSTPLAAECWFCSPAHFHSQHPPGALDTSRSHPEPFGYLPEPPGALWIPPGATRSHLEPPEATRSHPRPPEATRSHPESPGATRATFNHPEPTSTALKPLVALNDSHHLDPPAPWCG